MSKFRDRGYKKCRVSHCSYPKCFVTAASAKRANVLNNAGSKQNATPRGRIKTTMMHISHKCQCANFRVKNTRSKAQK